MISVATLPRLVRQALPTLQSHLLSPQWQEPRIGIVHLGIGNFHRAHQALYTEEAMLAAGGDWGICGVTLQGDVDKRDALMAQQGLYSVVERGPHGAKVTVVRALREVLAMPHDRAALFARLADPLVQIVSLTVTEKGYCRDPKTGEVALDDPAVAHDLANPLEPRTVPGILVAALRERRDSASGKPFTVLSCDNLSHNGAALRQVVCSFARQRDPELADWIAAHVAFPSTMVDRIVPATTDAERVTVAHAIVYEDTVPVPCEPFRQWVIEDRFAGGRPAWEAVGAQLVEDVTPFELAKLRMLNGTHSTLAYLSMLGGFETIDAAISHPPMRNLIHAMMTEEIAPTLTMPASFDLAAYRDALLERYTNPALKHRCAQIAMDGSQKIPPRLLATIAARIGAGQPFTRLALAIAAWMMFLCGHADDGTRYEISDPLAGRLKTLVASADGEPQALMDALLTVREVFPEDLAALPEFRKTLRHALQLLHEHGARGAITALQ
ncbi:mannitol dehydrogenase family protein [Paraburkholderia sp. SEWSISQ10-3 4]|uniref:mannitol dehydrogenase family protein n=1 Tax=Paraburkholderia TaxID=1822464 RepID=UPI00225B3854|nr:MULTISPECIES: mannitol dehydrogenase family protein [Paraburkholderia]MCX4141833.1 mannitol dehydrogenase family protein [Paraburkholderia aspalathi]MDN7174513.1 mannitol dehydrogenase family protein [Paraburkholderia sp. SEWSISQ10-3 4]MDQ6504154.1 mannitol dehydrogenase family protein [Paraburkholderia aspalathi]